jgi:hypothetical protein
MKTLPPTPKARTRAKLCALGCAAVALCVFMLPGRTAPKPPPTPQDPQQQPCVLPPPVNVSPTPYSDVCGPSFPAGTGIPFQFFDDFSWRSFIAMVWPAKAGQRGVPDPDRPVGTVGTPLVFETLKADWEVFQPGGAAPSAWNEFTGQNPCGLASVGFNDLILASFSKFGNLGLAGFGNLVGALGAQNGTYVRYQTGFNQTEYTQILSQRLYLQENLRNVTFENGAVDVKAAWMLMKGVGHPERYYTRTAWVLDPGTGVCSQETVGLVGLHIVTKTPSRPQWIWSSFEQIDNIPQQGAQAPYALNDGTARPMPTPPNPIGFPPPTPTPTPIYNVTRLKPIPGPTMNTNAAYQSALANQGTGVWQYYQLVMTQWPTVANSPGTSGSPSFTFPGTGATTNFANVTMETFDQASIGTGCMACHNVTKRASDFLWSLKVNAFKPQADVTPPSFGIMAAARPAPRAAALSPELKQLKALLQGTVPKKPARPRKPARRTRKPR